MKWLRHILKGSEFLVLSGLAAFGLIQIVGNYSAQGFLIAGLWLGFWGGVKFRNNRLEKKIEAAFDEYAENDDWEEFVRSVKSEIHNKEI